MGVASSLRAWGASSVEAGVLERRLVLIFPRPQPRFQPVDLLILGEDDPLHLLRELTLALELLLCKERLRAAARAAERRQEANLGRAQGLPGVDRPPRGISRMPQAREGGNPRAWVGRGSIIVRTFSSRDRASTSRALACVRARATSR
ncbi:hypothetical protein OAO87_03240 [bacterium]|nr:hypothetical protein [bacterium]